MLKNIFLLILTSVIYLVIYLYFYIVFIDDCYFYYGKNAEKWRKKTKGFWRKFFFIDIRDKVVIWHYVLFWINFITFVLTEIFIVICSFLKAEQVKVVIYILIVLYSLSVIPITYVRIGFYWPNRRGKIKDRKKYKKEHYK